MLQKKICLLGRAPGKNRIVSGRFHSVFSERYRSTIGVSVHRKRVDVDGTDVSLLLWDVNDGDEFNCVRASYLRGMSGYALVVDESDSTSAESALRLHELARKTVGEVPFVTLYLDQSAEVTAAENDERVNWLIDDSFQKLAREIFYGR